MRRRHRGAITSLALTLAIAAHADALDPDTRLQHYPLATWTESEGLSSGFIRAITQDLDGYLWLGTASGLVRFDGVNFMRWEAAQEPGLPTLAVATLLTGGDGSLWIGFVGHGGVSRVRNGQVTNYSSSDGVSEGSMTALFEDSEGTLWAGSRLGLSRFRRNRWEVVDLPREWFQQSIWHIYEDRQRQLWIAADAGVLRRIPGEDVFRPVASPPLVRGFSEDLSGTMWVTTHDQAITRLTGQKPSEHVSDVERNGLRLLRDRNGSLWVGTLGKGVFRFGPGSRDRRPTTERLTEKEGLTSDVVWALFEDREGNVWVGTQHGLNRLSNSVVVPIPRHDDGVLTQSRPVRVITTSQQDIWVGTNDGLFRFSGSERKRYHLSDGLPNVGIYAIHGDRRGRLWIADEAGGVTRLEGERFIPLPIPRGALHRISALTSDQRGALWIVDMNRGVFRWIEGGPTSFDQPVLTNKGGVSALTDSRGRVWIGFVDGGLVVYDEDRVVWYSQRDGMAGNTVNALYEDTRGGIWVGTREGLSRFSDGQFLSLTATNGFPGNDVTSIVQDLEGYLWLGVNEGVIRINPDDVAKVASDPRHQPQYTLFDKSDGLPGAPTGGGYPTATRDRAGVLWFVTGNGLAAIDPRRAKALGESPPVHVEDVIVDGREVDPLPQLRLPPRTSRLQINYTGVNFAAALKTRFRYQLEGFDLDWIDAGMRRQAFYTNLAPGTYRFRVMSNANGVWNEKGATWEFSIQPAFYQTGWFYAMSVTVFGLGLYVLWRFRVRRLREQFAAVLGERTRMGREIHDTLLQGLVGVALQFDDLSSKLNSSPETAKGQLERLRRHVERSIRETRQSIWDLRSPLLEMRDLVSALREASETITGTTVQFEFASSGTPRRASPRTEEQLLRIGQEAIANAVRHAHAKSVRMELHYDHESVALRIVDDGVGFDSHADHLPARHWGLLGMQERAQKIGGRCRVISRPGHGTEVEAVVPLGMPKTVES